MKKIIVNLLIFLMLISLCGCSNCNECSERNKTYTEAKGDLLITYIYSGDYVISKNIYDKNTDITTDYTYYYENNGWGNNLVGMNIVTITRDGEIIDQSEDE